MPVSYKVKILNYLFQVYEMIWLCCWMFLSTTTTKHNNVHILLAASFVWACVIAPVCVSVCVCVSRPPLFLLLRVCLFMHHFLYNHRLLLFLILSSLYPPLFYAFPVFFTPRVWLFLPTPLSNSVSVPPFLSYLFASFSPIPLFHSHSHSLISA